MNCGAPTSALRHPDLPSILQQHRTAGSAILTGSVQSAHGVHPEVTWRWQQHSRAGPLIKSLLSRPACAWPPLQWRRVRSTPMWDACFLHLTPVSTSGPGAGPAPQVPCVRLPRAGHRMWADGLILREHRSCHGRSHGVQHDRPPHGGRLPLMLRPPHSQPNGSFQGLAWLA